MLPIFLSLLFACDKETQCTHSVIISGCQVTLEIGRATKRVLIFGTKEPKSAQMASNEQKLKRLNMVMDILRVLKCYMIVDL